MGGRYRLVGALDQPGQTPGIETWEAIHVELERPVALEFLPDQSGIAERMIEDARAVARVRHPHVIEYSDFGRDANGQAYLVTERLVGQTVEQLIARRGSVPWARTVAIVQQLADALGAAHQHGIIHADLRPANVVLLEGRGTGQADFVKLVGFGGTRASPSPSAMSPEQCRGEPLDPRSDIYALGCLLFAMITGDPPFVGEPQLVAWQQQHEQPKTLRERAPRQFIPDELEWVVARCLAKPREQRFGTTGELGVAIAQLAQFAAATSQVAGIAPEPLGGEPRVMGYAGRPAPRSPRELTNSYAPVPVAVAPARKPERTSGRAPSPTTHPPTGAADAPLAPGMIVAATLFGVVAVLGFGFGMYSLVQHLIAEPTPPSAQVEVREVVAPIPPTATAPTPTAPSPPPTVTAVAPQELAAPTTPASAASTAAAKPSATAKPSKASPKPAPTVEPEPTPEPTPTPSEAEPKPKPKPAKPSAEPDSKAKDKIDYDELLDPWG